MSKLIFIDVEANGPCPGLGFIAEFGAVELDSEISFHGVMWRSADLATTDRHGHILQKDLVERAGIMNCFELWLGQFARPGSRFIMVSDNPAFDFQWMNYEFWHTLGRTPLGHSACRISDFYAGLVGNFYETQK